VSCPAMRVPWGCQEGVQAAEGRLGAHRTESVASLGAIVKCRVLEILRVKDEGENGVLILLFLENK
jgi:hypothetical protein